MGIQLMSQPRILYTYTDEAPALATYSLLPIIQAFTRAAGVVVETRDISLAGRIIAGFPDELSPDRRRPDDLAELGEIAKTAEANIIKLPNISASIPQLQAAIRELQQRGYAVPDYPEDPRDERQKAIKAKYAKVLGSAVNPVLREGNSDRRVASAVKAYARSHPHSMGVWSRDSKTHVSHMDGGDFYGNEQSAVIAESGVLRIELIVADGTTGLLKEVKVDANDVVGASMMSRRALQAFFAQVNYRRRVSGPPPLTAPEGDDDEGVRSDHVRTRGAGVLQGRVREARRHLSVTRRRSRQRHRRRLQQDSEPPG
jgi:isocitrate dehydrogenase